MASITQASNAIGPISVSGQQSPLPHIQELALPVLEREEGEITADGIAPGADGAAVLLARLVLSVADEEAQERQRATEAARAAEATRAARAVAGYD